MSSFLERRPLLTVALRDLASSYSRFIFIIAAMALGIAALVGVRGSGESVRRQFLQDTRALLGADVVVQSTVYPTDEQRAAVAKLNGIDSTLVAETMAMAGGAAGSRSQVVDISVVDPAKYPFYGRVEPRPQEALSQALSGKSVVASETLLSRLNAKVGDTIQIAGQEFRVAAVLVSQPDRLFNDSPMALPVLMSSEAFEHTGLKDTGRRLSTRYLFKVTGGDQQLDKLRSELTALFPGTQITDSRSGKPELSKAIDRATSGLSMICLFALVLACAGLSMTMRSHLRERLDAIATMKSLGATFGQVLGIYLFQIVLLALIGSMTGIVIGFGLEYVLLHFARNFLSGTITPAWTWQTSIEALITGVFSTLLLTLPVLLDIRQVKPLLILRRDFEPESKHRWRIALFSAPIVLGLGLIAFWLSSSLQIAVYFLGGLIAALTVLGVTAYIVLLSARAFARSTRRVSFLFNYSVKSLSRPGNQTIAVLVALGISAGFTLGVFLIQRTVLQELSERVPQTLPNLILAGVTRYERPDLDRMLQSNSSVTQAPEFIPMAQARLAEVDGKPPEERMEGHHGRYLLQAHPVAGVDTPPSGATIVQGKWWNAASTGVAVREDIAQRLRLSPGSQLTFQIGERTVTEPVAAVYKWEERSLASSFAFMLPLKTFGDVPVLYVGGVHLKRGTDESVQEAIYSKFPTITIFNLSDIVHAFEAITDELTLIVKSLAAFVIAAGLGVLAASVAGGQMERSREVVFLKSIGATRRQIVSMSSIEFLLLGALAGGIGATFASTFAAFFARRMFQFTLHTHWGLIVATLLLTASLAIIVGWLASYRVLQLRPNEALR